MPKPDNDYRRELQFAAWLPLLLGGVFVLCMWVPYFAAALWGIKVLGGQKKPSDTTVTFYLWLGAIMTAIVIPAALWRRARRLRLLQTGVWTKGRPIHIGGLAKAGMCPVTFAYVVNGQEFTKTVDVATLYSNEYDDNTRIPIVYDPHNPKVCHILSRIISTDDQLPPGYGDRSVSPPSPQPGSPRNPGYTLPAAPPPSAVRPTLVRDRTGAIVVIAIVAVLSLLAVMARHLNTHIPAPPKPEVFTQMREAQSHFGYQPATQTATKPFPPVNGEWKSTATEGPSAGNTIEFIAGGGGTCTLTLPDAGNPGQPAPAEYAIRWKQSGASVTVTLFPSGNGRRPPARQMIQSLTLDEAGTALRYKDGRGFKRQD